MPAKLPRPRVQEGTGEEMAESTVYLNGEFVSYSEAKIPVEDRSIQFGDSVYEVVRYYKQRPFRMDQHMQRLQRSADMIELSLPPLDELIAAMGEVIRRDGMEDATVYIQVSRGVGSRFHGVPTGLTPTVIALANPAPIIRPKPYMTCVTIGDTRWSQPYIKTTLLLPNAMAREHARRMGADDAIMVRDGLLTEASASNVFAVFGDRLVTSPVSNYILPGITREAVLEMAREDGITCEERPVPATSLYQADGLLLTGTTPEVSPVVELDKRVIGTGHPPALHGRLMELFDEAALGVTAGA